MAKDKGVEANSPILKYHGHYPSAARYMMNEGVLSSIRQTPKTFKTIWASGGVNITYNLVGMGPSHFLKYRDSLLLASYQEAMRYKDVYTHIGAGFDVKLLRKKGAKMPWKYEDNPNNVVTFQAHMKETATDGAEVMVYGPGYETPSAVSLADKADQIADIIRRYDDKVQKQRPFKVLRLFIHCRNRTR